MDEYRATPNTTAPWVGALNRAPQPVAAAQAVCQSKVHAKVECFGFDTKDVRLVLTDRNDQREIRMHNDDAWFIVEAIAAAHRASPSPAVQPAAQAVPEGFKLLTKQEMSSLQRQLIDAGSYDFVTYGAAIARGMARLASGAPAETPKPDEMPDLPHPYSFSRGGRAQYTAEQMKFFRDNCVRVALANAAQPAPAQAETPKPAHACQNGWVDDPHDIEHGMTKCPKCAAQAAPVHPDTARLDFMINEDVTMYPGYYNGKWQFTSDRVTICYGPSGCRLEAEGATVREAIDKASKKASK